MQRPHGRSTANVCALAMLAAELSFALAAPYSRGNPQDFTSFAPALDSSDVADLAPAHWVRVSMRSAESLAGMPDAEAVQLERARREKLVADACAILLSSVPATNTVAGDNDGNIELKPAFYNTSDEQMLLDQTEAVESEWNDERPPRVRVLEDYDCYEHGGWTWQWLPTGLIYRSYMAGVHEPRASLVAFHEGENRTLWDATLGGRFGILRCGDCDPLRPQGWQVDFYGAAISRLDVENQQDLDATDYVFGVPLTFGRGDWQFKFGYAHLSSHLGDELALREPTALDERRNYVRDAIVFGTSVFLHPVWRQYGEVGWAFHNSGGAQPWEAQFGTEISLPGPGATPFFAVNGRMREEHDFGGDLTVHAGWLRRGGFGQTLRFGAHYYNGKSSQFQFFDQAEEQIGLGLWYDF